MPDRFRRSMAVAATVVVFAIAGCSSSNSPSSTEPSGSGLPPGPEIAATDPSGSGLPPGPEVAITDPSGSALPPGPEVAITDPPDGDDAVVPEGFTLVTIVVTDADGNEHVVCVWLADTAEKRRQGLMGVTDLGGADGMLFSYEQPANSNFWMFGTPMPLSIAFFDSGGSFVSSDDMTPCIDTPAADCRRYPAAAPYVHALEVPAGGLDRLGVGPGSRLDVGPAATRPACARV
jgi:uncharacterized membrane protein (UPF0127 family)